LPFRRAALSKYSLLGHVVAL